MRKSYKRRSIVKLCAGADIIIGDYWENPEGRKMDRDKIYVLRTKKEDFFSHYEKVGEMLIHVARLNIILTDVDTFTEADFDKYKSVLAELAFQLKDFCNEETIPQFNLLTDRMLLDSMNNCNAGWENISLLRMGNFMFVLLSICQVMAIPLVIWKMGLISGILSCIV